MVNGDWAAQVGWDCAAELLRRQPEADATFAANDQLARGAIDRLQSAGRDVPADVAVVGHDNWEVLSRYGRTPMTSVDMRLDKLGVEALNQLYSDTVRISGLVAVPPELRIRQSSAGAAPVNP